MVCMLTEDLLLLKHMKITMNKVIYSALFYSRINVKVNGISDDKI